MTNPSGSYDQSSQCPGQRLNLPSGAWPRYQRPKNQFHNKTQNLFPFREDQQKTLTRSKVSAGHIIRQEPVFLVGLKTVSVNTATSVHRVKATMPSVSAPKNANRTQNGCLTKLNVEGFESMLQGYPLNKLNYLVDGFKFGFRIGYNGPQLPSHLANHPSANKNPRTVDEMILKEIKLNRVAGPFDTPPFDNLICSPLALIEKKESGKYRLIHNLSFPRDKSINAHIDKSLAAVKYETFDYFINLVQEVGRGAMMAKCDIEEAFRFIPINPDDYHLLGFTWRKKFYYDKRLPMGCRMSCAIFESFSKALQWICIHRLFCSKMSHILDDFLFVGPPNSLICQNNLEAFIHLCEFLNIPIKHSKTYRPNKVMEAHGIEIDSEYMQYRLPHDKLTKAKVLLTGLAKRKKVTLKELQSAIGFLQFACKAIVPGRAFLRRLIDLTVGVRLPHHHVRISQSVRSDITLWLQFLESFNNKSIFLHKEWVDANSLRLLTDASGSIGYGGTLGSKWFAGLWPATWSNVCITAKELLPITLAVEMWGHLLANPKNTYSNR